MTTIRDAQAAAVRARVLDAVCDLVAAGDELTFAKVAVAAGVPERTVYRYFPNRQALITALYDHVNDRIGFDGELPTDHAAMDAMVRRVFPGFDSVAPLIDELLASPDGRRARLANLEQRQAAALAVVADARPDLDTESTRQVAAVVQVLGTAAVWRSLNEFWSLDGTSAAAAVATALDILLDNHHHERN